MAAKNVDEMHEARKVRHEDTLGEVMVEVPQVTEEGNHGPNSDLCVDEVTRVRELVTLRVELRQAGTVVNKVPGHHDEGTQLVVVG
jgi:hypothetical protein